MTKSTFPPFREKALSQSAKEGTRTLDLRITNATRYQLRHFGTDIFKSLSIISILK